MIHIKIDAKNPQRQLAMISVGKGNVLSAEISGIPQDVSDVQIHFQSSVGAPYVSFAAEALAGWKWCVTVGGDAFKDVGDILYHVTAVNNYGNGTWYGTGKCRIMPSVLSTGGGGGGVDPDQPVVKAGEVYLKNRKTGLYHKLEVENDKNGNPYPVLVREGVSLS